MNVICALNVIMLYQKLIGSETRLSLGRTERKNRKLNGGMRRALNNAYHVMESNTQNLADNIFHHRVLQRGIHIIVIAVPYTPIKCHIHWAS